LAARRGRTALVREAAAKILPVLLERQYQDNAPHRLLRAAVAPDQPDATLLRPAGGPSETNSERLMRPVSEEVCPLESMDA
jgi:hypothetical protein